MTGPSTSPFALTLHSKCVRTASPWKSSVSPALPPPWSKKTKPSGFTAGTTTTLVARQLLHRKNLHIMTNAVNIAMELSGNTSLHTTLTGGSLRWANAFSLVGPGAIEALGVVVMDRLFLGATGVSAERGVTVIQPDEAAVFRTMVRQARQVVIVADSSKMGRVSPAGGVHPEQDRSSDHRQRNVGRGEERVCGNRAESACRVGSLPPLRSNTAPVVKEFSSDTSRAATALTSFTSRKRQRGILLGM